MYARTFVETRRASIRGGGGRGGKCTIEVVVDDVAEVEVLAMKAGCDALRVRRLRGGV